LERVALHADHALAPAKAPEAMRSLAFRAARSTSAARHSQGVIVATLGFGIVFTVDAASFVARLVCLLAMRLPVRWSGGRAPACCAKGIRVRRRPCEKLQALSPDCCANCPRAHETPVSCRPRGGS
jgi:hypothetical protein